MPRAASEAWLTRRRTMGLLALGAMLCTTGPVRSREAETPLSADQAIQFIRQSSDRLIAILDGSADSPEKWRQLEVLIDERVDVYGIARFALGRFWNVASSQQREECARLYPAILAGYIRKTLGTGRIPTVTIDRATPIEGGIEVRTAVLLASVPPRLISWAVGTINGTPKIIDIIAEGASLRITQRNDCANFLAHNNHDIAALIETLRREA